jgi:hypothetical protein
MKTKELLVGEVYDIAHARKGSFTGKLLSCDEDWATFEITKGKANARIEEYAHTKGEEITLRISLCSFWKLKEAK